MEASSSPGEAREKKSLENYASFYLGTYLNTVKKEHPEQLPALARNEFYDVQVCLMPNDCFAMLFEKADKKNIEVREADWEYVEGKVRSGVTHLVAVYAHEGATVADAIARGKRDAVRDIRSLEDSNIARAASQLERILTDLTKLEKGNRSIAQLGERELKKLEPVKDAILNAGPEIDMVAVIDALKSYPTRPSTVNVEIKGKELLEKIASDLGDLSDVIRRVESQDAKLEELEQSLKKVLGEYNRTIDERISKGLAVILSSSDKKIDKGLAALGDIKRGPPQQASTPDEPSAELAARLAKMDKSMQALHIQLQEVATKRLPSVELPKDLEVRLDALEKGSQAIEMQVLEKLTVMEQRQLKEKELKEHSEKENVATISGLAVNVEEVKQIQERLSQATSIIVEIKEKTYKMDQRIAKIEDQLVKIQAAAGAPRQRTLKQKEPEPSVPNS